MKVLLLHPEDLPWQGQWADTRWDLIVDLGFAGPAVYADWSRRSGTRVISLHQFAGETESYRWVNRLIEAGRGRLLDRMGIDWWEIFAPLSYHDLQALYLLGELRRELSLESVEWAATRPHIYADLLPNTSGQALRYFRPERSGPLHSVLRMVSAARQLRPAQVVEIAFDKWDASYSIRHQFAKHNRPHCEAPIFLLPSAYSNVTDVLLAYAAQLPTRRFLLTTTRRSGWTGKVPPNVNYTTLAAYAVSSGETQSEAENLRKAWQSFQCTVLDEIEELRQGREAGFWRGFPNQLQIGLRVRDAWKFLIEQEPVQGVLCGDDLNYTTRLPLILAKLTGRSAVYCNHGALDGGMLFKQPYADTFLVKGDMERDYLARARAIAAERIEIGAPEDMRSPKDEPGGKEKKRDLVFFSQPYEVSAGRGLEIYGELLPRLCSVARRTGRRVVVKLHPFESEKNRRLIIKSILPEADRALVQIVSRTPVNDIIACAWCGVGVDSSVAVECVLQGVPYFLCRWLDCNGFGYVSQFARFGAGRLLHSPDELEMIPEMVSDYHSDPALGRSLRHAATAEQLDQIMSGSRRVSEHSVASQG